MLSLSATTDLLLHQLQSALSGRRKLEVDLQTLQQEHEELQAALRGSVEKAKKAGVEVKHRKSTTLF